MDDTQVSMIHEIKFRTTRRGDYDAHLKAAQEVTSKLERLAPLMIEERLLEQELEAVRAKIREINE